MAPRFLGWRAGLQDTLPGAENALLPQISPRSPSQTGESFLVPKAIWSDEVDELRCSDGFKVGKWRRECHDELGRLQQLTPRQPPKERRGKRPSPYLPPLATPVSPQEGQRGKTSEDTQLESTVHYGDQLICRGDLGALVIERQRQQEQRGRQRLQVDLEVGTKQRQLAVEWRKSRDRQAASKSVSRVLSTSPAPPPAPEIPQEDEDEVSEKVRSRLEKLKSLTKSSVLLGKGLTHKRDLQLRARLRSCVLNGVQNKHQRSRKVMKEWERRRHKMAKLPREEAEALSEAFALFASGRGQGGMAAADLVRCLAELGLEGENSHEKQPIKEMCEQTAVAFHEDLECVTSTRPSHPRSFLCLKPLPENVEDGDQSERPGSRSSSPIRREQPREGGVELELGADISPVCLEDFCIEVVQAARQLLAEARYDMHFTEFVEACGTGGVSLDEKGFKRLADRVSVDAKLVQEAVQATKGSSARLSELSGLSPASSEIRSSPSPTKKAPSAARGSVKHAAAHSTEPEPFAIEFDAAHDLLSTLREKTQRQCRRQERDIRHRTRMPNDFFWQYRCDLIRFFELFSMFDVDKSLCLSPGEFKQLLKVIGLQPYSEKMAVFVDKIIMESDENGDEQIDFNEFVSLMNKVREHQKSRRRDTFVQRFLHYDKDGSGQLSLKDMELLFRDVGCQAQCREQHEILRQLIEKFDADVGEDVSFPQLEDLCQRVAESLFRFVNEQHMKEAEAVGCSREKFAEYQWAFDQLDVDGSGSLSAAEVDQVLRMLMVRPPSAQELQALYEEIDKSNDGDLDFKDFLRLMTVASSARGMFAQELPLTLRDVPERSLRDCLKAFALSDSYVRELPAPELPTLVGGYIGARPSDNLREDLPQPINNVRQLVDFARQRARSMGILGGMQISQQRTATVRLEGEVPDN